MSTTADAYFGEGETTLAGPVEPDTPGDIPGGDDMYDELEMNVYPVMRPENGEDGGVRSLGAQFRNDVFGGTDTLEYSIELSDESGGAVVSRYLDELDYFTVRGVKTEEYRVMRDGAPEEAHARPDYGAEIPLAVTEENLTRRGDGSVQVRGTYDLGAYDDWGFIDTVANAFSGAGTPASMLEVTAVDDVLDEPLTRERYFPQEEGMRFTDYLSGPVRQFLHGIDTQPLLFGRSPGNYTRDNHDYGVYRRFRHAIEEKDRTLFSWGNMPEAVTAAGLFEGMRSFLGRSAPRKPA